MKKKGLKKKIKDFIKVLKKISPKPKQKIDHGLIVVEDIKQKPKVSLKKVKNGIDAVFCSDAGNYSNVVDKLIKANKSKKDLLIEVRDSINPKVISLLKTIAVDQSINLEDYKEKDVFHLNLNKNLRIIFLSKRSTIEKEVEYEFFYNLFGPILSI